MTVEQQIGYLVAKVEELSADSKRMAEKLDALELKVNDKFRTAELTLRILKFVGLAIGVILTFKFGDLPKLWLDFFG